jgi:hypothetical protein
MVTTLAKGEELFVFDASAEEHTIDGGTARWYRVANSAGAIGWAFGGYLDASRYRPGDCFLPPEDEAWVEIEVVDERFDNGSLVRVGVNAREQLDPATWSSREVLFVRPRGGTARAIRIFEAGTLYDGDVTRDISVETMELVEDARKEIWITFFEAAGDGHQSSGRIYAPSASGGSYRQIGEFGLGSGGTGDICGYSSSGMSGPEAIVRDGIKKVRFVVRNQEMRFEGFDEAGKATCVEEVSL